MYLRNCVAVAITGSNENLAVFGGRLSSNRLRGLEQNSYARRVQNKKDRF